MLIFYCFFFFNVRRTTEIYSLSLHDALPISFRRIRQPDRSPARWCPIGERDSASEPCGLGNSVPVVASCAASWRATARSEEHTSELQSLTNLVCRLLLEKKKKNNT